MVKQIIKIKGYCKPLCLVGLGRRANKGRQRRGEARALRPLQELPSLERPPLPRTIQV